MSDTADAAPAVDPKSIVDDDKKKSNEDKAKNKQSKAEKFAAKQAKQAAAGGGGGGGGGGNKKKEEKKEQGAVGQGGGSDKEGITVPKSVSSFADWYAQIVTKSDLIDYYDISGCYIFRPYAFSIWEFIQSFFDGEIKKLGVKNAYFPMFISKKHLEKEKDHVEGFAPEVAWVTKAGETELPEQIAIRPTSETIMYPYYSKWIRSHRDLPLKLNQWTNVVRWEFKYPTPFIRTREFLWQEGHSAFATLDEAAKEVLDILNLYERVYQDLLAVPVVKGKKTEVEKFAGGYYTTTVEAFIPVVGRGVQGATSHCLGQNFAKMFNIEYESEKGKKELVWQNSWGLTTRTLGVLIMVHSDNKGLILPPRVAPIQVIVVPIIYKESESIIKAADEVVEELKAAGIRVDIDKRDTKTPAYKFNYWELRGVPIRIEIGPKDVEQSQVTTMRRDQSEDKTKKISVKRSELIESIKNQLNTMQNDMLNRARDHASSHRKRVENWSELMAALDERCTVLAPHCDVTSCEEQIKKRTAEESKAAAAENNASITNTGEEVQKLTGAAKSLCIPFEQPSLAEGTKCVNCGNPAKHYTLFGRSY